MHKRLVPFKNLSEDSLADLALLRISKPELIRITIPTFADFLQLPHCEKAIRTATTDALSKTFGRRIQFRSKRHFREFCLGTAPDKGPLIHERELLARVFRPKLSKNKSAFRLNPYLRQVTLGSYANYLNAIAEELRRNFEDQDHHPLPGTKAIVAIREYLEQNYSAKTQEERDRLKRALQFQRRPLVDNETWIDCYRRNFECEHLTDEAIEKRAERGRKFLNAHPRIRLTWLRPSFVRKATEAGTGFRVYRDGVEIEQPSSTPWMEHWVIQVEDGAKEIRILAIGVPEEPSFWPTKLLKYMD